MPVCLIVLSGLQGVYGGTMKVPMFIGYFCRLTANNMRNLLSIGCFENMMQIVLFLLIVLYCKD